MLNGSWPLEEVAASHFQLGTLDAKGCQGECEWGAKEAWSPQERCEGTPWVSGSRLRVSPSGFPRATVCKKKLEPQPGTTRRGATCPHVLLFGVLSAEPRHFEVDTV